eukprot:5716537-Amphidinium_carterae.1
MPVPVTVGGYLVRARWGSRRFPPTRAQQQHIQQHIKFRAYHRLRFEVPFVTRTWSWRREWTSADVLACVLALTMWLSLVWGLEWLCFNAVYRCVGREHFEREALLHFSYVLYLLYLAMHVGVTVRRYLTTWACCFDSLRGVCYRHVQQLGMATNVLPELCIYTFQRLWASQRRDGDQAYLLEQACGQQRRDGICAHTWRRGDGICACLPEHAGGQQRIRDGIRACPPEHDCGQQRRDGNRACPPEHACGQQRRDGNPACPPEHACGQQ